jgi:hypothetical protein
VGKNRHNQYEERKFRYTDERPRHLITYDHKIIIREMMDWVKKEDSINFCDFCFERGYTPALIWKLEKDIEEFHNAYQLVRMKLAVRREELVNAELLCEKAFSRYQAHYDPFLRGHEEELKDKDAKRKRGAAEQERVNLVMLAKLANQGLIAQEE